MDKSFKNILERLNSSRFRAGIKLNKADREYCEEKGLDVIRVHARNFVLERLAPANPKNDTKQTPYKGHPVFTAQHATATCCRKCLASWHKIEKGKTLTKKEIDYIVEIIMKWLFKEMYS